jgi:fumarate reductase flavoprotein subunit
VNTTNGAVFDVVVVGGGGAGMAAAITAHDAGARVLLVECESRLGGSTALSGGIFFAAGTPVQAAKGVEGDTADAMYEYYTLVNRWRVDPAVVRTLCDHAAPCLQWLVDLGVVFPVELLHKTGMERIPRGHRADGEGAAIAAALERACRARDIDIALGRRVRRLLTHEGRVVGVATEDEQLHCGAVVVSCGGFGQDAAMLARYYPQAAAAGWTWSVAATGSRGDGIRFAEQVGAAVDGHDHGLLVPTPGLTAMSQHLPGWLVHVNRAGRRFMDESSYLSIASQRMADQGGSCITLFDQASRATAGSQPGFGDLCTGGDSDDDAGHWTPDLQVKAEDGLVARASSIASLAESMALPPAALEATVEQYNEACAAGRDDRFFKDPAHLRPLSTPPYFAVVVRPSVVALTGCGMRIDREARTLDANDRPIPGLFAAGEATGNVLGDIYIGSGNSIAGAIVFGRIAGASAAASITAPASGAGPS